MSRTNASHLIRSRSSAAVCGLAAALIVAACGGGSDEVASDSVVAVEAEAPAAAESDEPPSEAGSDETASAEPEPAGDGAAVQESGPIRVTGSPLAVFDSSIPDDTVGLAAPVVDGESFDGTPISIGSPTANPTMVVFLAHWCPHCNDEIPELVSLEDAGSIPDGLDVVGVSTAVDSSAPNFPPSQWVVDKGWPWPTMADDAKQSAIAAMGGSSFPFTVILDTDGTVLARKGGSASAEQTLEFINAALG